MSRKQNPHFAPRVPLSVRGGIRVQANRGGFARKWWSREWLLLLEKYRIGARLGRGRSYAYAGQVASLELGAGRVVAHVQGADQSAYDCEIVCPVLEPAARVRVIGALRQRPLLLAQLLVRELPEAVNTLFAEAGQPLTPGNRTELTTRCTCPDRVNPCKHLAAVFFLLIEAFEQDPLLLLALRGIDRAQLTGATDEGRDDGGTAPLTEARAEGPPPVMEPRAFWGSEADETPDFGPAPTGSTAAPLVQRLGPLPFWRGEERFLDVLTQAGARAVTLGWQAWAGERMPRVKPAVVAHPELRLRGARMKMESPL